MNNRIKLDTAIEKEVYQLMEKIKVHTDSFVQLYSRRKGLKIDDAILNELVRAVLTGIDDGYMTHIDVLKKNVDKVLTKYVEEENPFQLSPKGKKAVS